MIRSSNKFVSNHIQNKRNRNTYNNTTTYITKCLFLFGVTDFKSLKSAFYNFYDQTFLLTDNMTKTDKKYFNLAVFHCEDVINSVDRRFVTGLQKRG